jgi:hypothetical protein
VAKYRVAKKLPPLPITTDHRARYDWNHARRDYVEGVIDEDGTLVYPNNKQIAEKYDIPIQSLANKIHKERWRDHRVARERERSLEVQQERVKKLAKKAVIFDETTLNAAQAGIRIILNRLLLIADLDETDEQRIRGLKQAYENGEADDADFQKEIRRWVYYAEITELSKALEKFQIAGRTAAGIKEDESAITQNNTVNISLTQTNIREELERDDETRAQALLSVLRNPNLVLPGITDQVLEGTTVDEPLEITDGSPEADENDRAELI